MENSSSSSTITEDGSSDVRGHMQHMFADPVAQQLCLLLLLLLLPCSRAHG
jgi:hypothetical protein